MSLHFIHKCTKKRAVVVDVERSIALFSKGSKLSPSTARQLSPPRSKRRQALLILSPWTKPSSIPFKEEVAPFSASLQQAQHPPLSNGTGAAATCPLLPLPLFPQWSVRAIERDQKASPHAHPWYHCLWMPHECPFLLLIVAPLIPHV